VLERAAKSGMTVQALLDRPSLPFYIKVIYDHFQILSFSRNYSQIGALPIDISTILSYNETIVKMPPAEFLYYIQSLDHEFLKKKETIKLV